jgi:cytochrome c5
LGLFWLRGLPYDENAMTSHWRGFLPALVVLGAALLLSLSACLRSSTPSMPSPALLSPVPTLRGDKLRLDLGAAAKGNQVTRGGEIYRLVCQDCHGDRGQGLTGDFLEQWAPEDRNCWQSKCHASNHPPGGFVLPHYIPPILGPDTLGAFDNALELYNYISLNMPWYEPGLLNEQDTWDVVTFILGRRGVTVPIELNAVNASHYPVTP